MLPVHVETIDPAALADRYTSIHNCIVDSQELHSYIDDRLVPAVTDYLLHGKCDGTFFSLNKVS